MFGNIFDLLGFNGIVIDTSVDAVDSADLTITPDLYDGVHDGDVVFPDIDDPLNYRSILDDNNGFANEFDGIDNITGASLDLDDSGFHEHITDSEILFDDTTGELMDEVHEPIDLSESNFIHNDSNIQNADETIGNMDDKQSYLESNSSNVSFRNRYDDNTEKFVKKMEEYGVEIPRSVDRTYNDSHKVTMDRHSQGGMTGTDKHLCRSSINKAFENNKITQKAYEELIRALNAC